MSTGRHIVPSTVPRLVRHAERSPLLTRLPVIVIAGFTMIAALVAGVVMRLSDPSDFRSLPDALWWSVQTITTVGYGDIVPRHTEGRVIAAIVMLMGIALIAVVTATVTATWSSPAAPTPRQSQMTRSATGWIKISNRLLVWTWGQPQIMQVLGSILLTAAHGPRVREKLTTFVTVGLLPAVADRLDDEHRLVRASLISSHLFGLTMIRWVWKLEPIASWADERVVSLVAPTVQRYLDGAWRDPRAASTPDLSCRQRGERPGPRLRITIVK